MIVIVGLIIVLVCVFGVFVAVGGNMDIIAHAAPHELATILGAGIGAFLIANLNPIIKIALKGLKQTFKGAKWKKQDYVDLLCLMFLLVKTARTKGVVAIEGHIERPEESKLFQNFPNVAADHHVVDFICDYFRMVSMNFEDPYQMEDAMVRDLEKHHGEEHAGQHALQIMADGLPAIGIVAAVLGVIKTMGAINQPTEILGAMIGGALVGTFLGVLLSYCIVGPLASRLGQILEEEGKFMEIVKTVIICHLQGQPPQIALEVGRRSLPGPMMVSFNEMEEAVNSLGNDLV